MTFEKYDVLGNGLIVEQYRINKDTIFVSVCNLTGEVSPYRKLMEYEHDRYRITTGS